MTLSRKILKKIAKISPPLPSRYGAGRTNERARWAKRLAQFDGAPVAILQSGMDCDCSTWRNRLIWVGTPTVSRVLQILDEQYDGAEGPLSHEIISHAEFEAAQIPEDGRDLMLEAFEDGHPHCVYA